MGADDPNVVDERAGRAPSGRPVVDVIEEGLELYTGDGELVGHVDEMGPDYLIVGSSPLTGTGLWIPRSAVARSDDRALYLRYSRDQVETMGWERDLAGDAAGPPFRRDDRSELRERAVAPPDDAGARRGGVVDTGDVVRVPIVEEQVEVVKRPRVVEYVEIEKTQRRETRPVRETVRRERVDVDATGDAVVRDRDPEDTTR